MSRIACRIAAMSSLIVTYLASTTFDFGPESEIQSLRSSAPYLPRAFRHDLEFSLLVVFADQIIHVSNHSAEHYRMREHSTTAANSAWDPAPHCSCEFRSE